MLVDYECMIYHFLTPTVTHSRYETKLTPPVKGVYQGAVANFAGVEDGVRVQNIIDFENIIGKKIVWATFSNNWGTDDLLTLYHKLNFNPPKSD
jgi:hypothetical protein